MPLHIFRQKERTLKPHVCSDELAYQQVGYMILKLLDAYYTGCAKIDGITILAGEILIEIIGEPIGGYNFRRCTWRLK